MTTTYRDLLEKTRASIREVSADEAQALLDRGAIAVDVREADEVEQGAIPGALHIPRGFLESRIEESVPDKDRPVVVYCA
ncbi:MAG TPA: rhodanese-like domain-containing protein, partial [Thermomicrobiales bacterium]